MKAIRPVTVCLCSVLAACESTDPMGAAPSAPPPTITAACAPDEAVVPLAANLTCQPLADDYALPSSGRQDSWPACISDGGSYVPLNMNISSLARVGAFEEISRQLGFGTGKAPSSEEFVAARVIYTQEQGIESRVSRREDEHYPRAPMPCNMMAEADQQRYPDRCVGPVKIRPILNKAFQEGIAGVDPVLNAARIEAALLWFLYVSIYKEATSAAQTPVDVDSMWAKYTGGEQRSGGIGFSRYVRARSAETHERIWDGLLAVRCWRDLDNPTGPAMNLALQERARAQLDRALLRAVALVVRQRAERVAACPAAGEAVKVLGRVLLREAKSRDATRAAVLEREMDRSDITQLDAPQLTGAMDGIFPCP
jgi:hypothetical protein